MHNIAELLAKFYHMAYFDKYGVEFSDDRKILVKCPKDFRGEYVIPEGVASIGEEAFCDCIGLTSIDIPDSVTSIEQGAFSNCTALTNINIPDSVTSIGQGVVVRGPVFFNCNNLKSPIYNKHLFIKLPISYLGAYTIPDGIESIAYSAFRGCTGLTSINIPDSVTSIGGYSFGECANLTDIIIPNSVTSIEGCAFFRCSGLTSIEIPDSVTSIGQEAFCNCSSLSEVTIPDSVEVIHGLAFFNCNNLKSPIYNKHLFIKLPTSYSGAYTIPDGIRIIAFDAFDGCNNLTSIEIPSSVTKIEKSAFRNCANIASIVVETGNTKYDSRHNCNAIIETASNTLIVGCKNTIIPVSVISIGDWAFSYCKGLTSVTIPEGVTSIGAHAFQYCKSLVSIAIPSSVKSIGQFAFQYCKSLVSITIPDSVQDIATDAFDEIPNINYHGEAEEHSSSFRRVSKYWGAYSLNGYVENGGIYSDYTKTKLIYCLDTHGRFVIPASVVEIDDDAFANCERVSFFDVAEDNSSFCSEMGVLFNKSKTTLLRFPPAEVEVFGDSYGIPDGVQYIKKWAFCNSHRLTYLSIPNSIKTIDDDAFGYDSGIIAIYYNGSIEEWCTKQWYLKIGHGLSVEDGYVLDIGWERIGHLVIPDGVLKIEDMAFKDCKSLLSVWIPKSVVCIGNSAFEGCSNLTTVHISEGVSTIGDNAFKGCDHLLNIELASKVKQFGWGAFDSCQCEISVPKGAKSYYLPLKKTFPNICLVERDNDEHNILFNLAKAYEFGIGVSQSFAQALITYIQAADKGSVEAVYRLGEWYQDGINVPQDKQKALQYFQQAARYNYKDASTRAEHIQKDIEIERQKELARQQELERQRQEEIVRQENVKVDVFELAPILWEKIDEHFHHGSCDGSLFIGPTDKADLTSFWNKYNEELSANIDLKRNKEILSAYPSNQYSIYYYYIDDNYWSSGIWKYNSVKEDWDCYIILNAGDL